MFPIKKIISMWVKLYQKYTMIELEIELEMRQTEILNKI